MNDWLEDKVETVKVWWLMLPGERKQAIMLMGVTVLTAVLNIATAHAETRIRNGPR